VAFAINTNVASLQAQNSLRVTGDLQSKTINRVTSGLRIVASGDDAAGLAIANTYRSDGAVLAQGVRNANDGLSQLQTADGGINNISQLLDRARTLATQSASGAFTGDRSVLNSEFQSVIQEIDRQAQAIGLNTGGQFAKALSVFIGGGQASNGISATTNGSVSLDLSRSTVDAASLGLKGVQAIGVSGTDIGSGSASTSLSTILSNATNTDSVSTPGFTTFVVKGPGFDGEGVKLSVNTANLGGTSDLTAAVNAAIQAAGNGGTQEATALKNANIIAGVNTDSNGRQQLTFTSPNAAFQVVAGDRLANALLGKFEQNATLTGADTAATIATNGGGTADDLTIAVDGGSAFTVTLGTTSATHSKGDIVKQLNADADFSEVATAYLEGNQVVLKSKTNSSSSSIEITSTTLATNLGLSTTEATAADASTGADLRTRVTAATETAAGSSTFGDAGAGTITFRIQGAGLAAPVDVAIAVTASTTVNQAISALDTAVGNNSSLKAAGVTLSTSTAGNTLTFTSTSGQAFSAQVTGDVQNKLGFGSFTTGANGAVDYSTITGSSNYDRTTAVGTNTFEISLNGGASSTNSIAVDLTGGDATKASLTGSDTNTSVQILSSNRRLNLEVNGVAFTVDLDRAEAGATKSDIADQINTVIAAQGRAYAEGNAIVIESDTAGAGGTVKILDGTANTALGFTTGQSDSGDSRSGASIAQFLNQAFAADAELQAAGLVADFGSTQANRITIKSTSGVDTFFRVNSRGSAAAASVHSTVKESVLATAGTRALSNTTNSYTITAGSNAAVTIAVDGGGNQAITLNAGTNRTANDIVAELNGKITGATAYVDQTGAIQIASNTTGTGSSVQFVAVANSAYATLGGATTGTSTGSAAGAPYDVTLNTNDKVYVSVNGGATQTFTLTAGTNRTAAQIVADFSDAEGFSVVDDGGTLKFVSSDTGAGATLEFKTGSNDAYTTLGLTASTVYSGNQAETGWGVAGATFTGNVNSSAPAIAGDIEAGGSSQSSAFAFSAIAYGTDDQTITVNASDTNGVQQSATITLRNDATARSGRSIDEAIATINTSLQQSNNATLQKIVAVKDNSDGSEKIRFLSAVNNFKVSIGSTANGTGVGSQGTTDTAELADGGSTASIVDVTSAQAAVSALADAVSLLGKAQAVVGRGQNQFAFAINLAQSQITNLAAAESRIRDADLAAESANLTKSQILLQAGIAALAQANSAPQQVLSLLRG
jgi:flagellin